MFSARLQQLFSSPALFFAVGIALFYGSEGGFRLLVSLGFLGFILACQMARAIGIPPESRIRKFLVRASTQQVLVAILCGLVGLMTLFGTPIAELSAHDVLYCGVAFLGMVSNICTARHIEHGFARFSNITLGSILLVPQVWGLASSSVSMFYNGGYTAYVSFPLLALAAWLGVFGRFGPYLNNIGMPFYLSIAHNFWYGLCNAIGANPNALVVVSCIASAYGSYLLGRMAVELGGPQNIAPDELVYVELPGLVYRAPRFAMQQDFEWEPVSFRP